MTKILLYSKTVVPAYLVAKLIALNPCRPASPVYLSFPAAMPIMFILEMILIKRIWSQKMRLRQAVNEIWLHRNGEEIEVFYMNRFFVAYDYSEAI